jgi:ribosomal protein L15
VVHRLPPNIDSGFAAKTRKGRLPAGLFVWGCRGERRGEQASRTGAAGVHRRSFEKKSRFEKISRCTQLFVTFGYYGVARLVGHRTCVLLR